ncbi:MAG: hypothetical protein AAF821_02635 [Cyanobacteria bacterium P01_D01_bin.156]
MLGLSHHHIGIANVLSIGLLGLLHNPSQAACLPGGCRQNGLVFSEASDNFEITDVMGTGTSNDPFVIHQDVWGLDISLAIDGLPQARQHSVFDRPGFAVSIVARNLTGAFWRFYDHELQEIQGLASHENDGLSFAQAIAPARPYTSTHYSRADEITDIRDFINFYRGAGVNPGETVRFNYFVTDTIPNSRFYIRQRPDYRPNETPTPPIAPILEPPVSPPAQPSSPVTAISTPAETLPPVASIPATQVTPSPLSTQAVPEPTGLAGGVALFLLSTVQKRSKAIRS